MNTAKKVDCSDRDRILRDELPRELESLARHAETCTECARELRIWNEISLAARGMQKSWESPQLWSRIRESLVAESQVESHARAGRQASAGIAAWWQGFALHWQTGAAALALIVVTVMGTWMLVRQHSPWQPAGDPQSGKVVPDAQKRLLTDAALREVQGAEQNYVKSIDKLASLAEPKLEHASSPLLVSYREKLLVLDAAIAECKTLQERNPLNAHLQQELVSIYQEKERTLEAVIRED